MFDTIEDVDANRQAKREQACSDSLCRKNVRRNATLGNNQQYKESLLCKLNLC